MSKVDLDTIHYNVRMSLIFDAWASATSYEEYNSMSNLDALLIISGDRSDEDVPRKTSAVQTWLLGYEFPSTFILMQKNRVTFLCSTNKAKILEPIRSSHPKIPVEILALPKTKDAAAGGANAALNAFIGLFASVQRVGTLTKEEQAGKTVNEYQAALKAAGYAFESVDISTALGAVMAIKDEEEMKVIRTTSNLCSTLISSYVVPKLELTIDKEKALSHAQFVGLIEHRLGDNDREPDMKVWSKGRGLTDVDFPSVEFVYSPQIQSQASGYTLKLLNEPSPSNLSFKGVILAAIGLKYKGYCANIARTYIVDPTPTQEAVYGLIEEIHKEVVGRMKEGAIARDIYTHALGMVKQKRPELEGNFVKNIGHAMGLEFKESAYVMSAKNGRVLRTNMVFNLAIGFQDVQDNQKGPKYTIQIADTMKVGLERGVCLTDAARDTKDCMFFFTNDEPAPPKKAAKPASPKKNGAAPSKIVAGKLLRTQTRSAGGAEVAQSTRSRIYPHQVELHAKRASEGIARFESGGGANATGDSKTWKRFISYKGDAALPSECSEPRIYIDKKALTVVLPIHGFAVPFHINTIKNASKNDENDYVYLRINFQTPGQLTGKKEDTPFEDPDATFIRSLTYRSLNKMRFDNLFNAIQGLKKDINKREQQKKEMADVVEQDRLIEVKGKRPHRLGEVFPRPPLDGKRLPGDVEIHQNGIRFTSMSNQRLDVLFSNIKHLFFAPCDNELVVLVHCHLRSPIIIGKKKTKDVQFYREATDMQFDETGNRKRKYRYGDEDEIEMEQAERKRRVGLNKEFKTFAEKISDAATESNGEPLELDIPYPELAFEGVPHRTNVKLSPTTDCLVYLTDPPFTVVTLSEIEIASLERVQFGLKQFDLVFVFRDFTRPPLQVNSIPSNQLNNVMEWLNDVDVPMAESQINLNWGPIMKTINEDPAEFFATGGWGFLSVPGQPSNEGGSSDSEEESAFSGSEESEASSEEASASDFDGSDASEDDEEMSAAGDESGDDWDALEARAAKSDMKNKEKGRGGGGSDSDVPKKKKPVPGKQKR